MSAKSSASAARVRLHTVEAPERLGGETRPYEYPHLYQIQAGDWRISYAVERNRLAILVLEVVNPDGTVTPDPVHESLARKMKIKLLDWPEGSPSRDLRPQDLGKKVKIKLLEMAEELRANDVPNSRAGGKVRLTGPSSASSRSKRITVLDEAHESQPDSDGSEDSSQDAEDTGRKVTPLGSPTM